MDDSHESLDREIFTQEMNSDSDNGESETDVVTIEDSSEEEIIPHPQFRRPPSPRNALRSPNVLGIPPRNTPRKRKSEEMENQPETSKSPAELNQSANDDGDNCSICFEPYQTLGAHRLSCLKCGHLFGANCIERWLPVGSKGGFCPTCKLKATRKDVRILYASRLLKVSDNSELEAAKQQVETSRAAARQKDMELAEIKLKLQSQQELITTLQQQVAARSAPSSQSETPSVSGVSRKKSGRMIARLLKSFDFPNDSECRVMDFCSDLSLVVCSQLCSNSLFPRYGLKKVNLANLTLGEYVPLHTKTIRDLKFSPDTPGVLLSVAEDKFMKITNMYGNKSMHSFDMKFAGCSCAWKAGDSNSIFGGLSNGSVVMYDTRMLFNGSTETDDNHVLTVSNPNIARTPVVSMHWISCASPFQAKSSGLLVGHSNKCVFYECVSPTEYKPHILPITGNLTSLSYNAFTNNLLASYRPSEAQGQRVDRHQFCEMTGQNISADPQRIDTMYSANVINTQRGLETSVVKMYRSFLWKSPAGSCLAATFAESTNTVKVWDAATGTDKLSLLPIPRVRDINVTRQGGKSLLNILGETSLRVYEVEEGF